MKCIFLVIIYICSSCITKEKINLLKRLLCCLVVLLREVTIHIQNRWWDLVFLRIRKRSSLCGFDFEGNPEKSWSNGKKYPWAESGIVYLCVREKKNNSFEISVIILRYIRNVNLSYSKRILKWQNFLRQKRWWKYMRKSKPASKKVANAEVDLN